MPVELGSVFVVLATELTRDADTVLLIELELILVEIESELIALLLAVPTEDVDITVPLLLNIELVVLSEVGGITPPGHGFGTSSSSPSPSKSSSSGAVDGACRLFPLPSSIPSSRLCPRRRRWVTRKSCQSSKSGPAHTFQRPIWRSLWPPPRLSHRCSRSTSKKTMPSTSTSRSRV